MRIQCTFPCKNKFIPASSILEICGAGRVAQVIEHMHSKGKKLSSNPSAAKEKLWFLPLLYNSFSIVNCKLVSTIRTIYHLHYIFENIWVSTVVSWTPHFQSILCLLGKLSPWRFITTSTCEIASPCLENAGKHNLRFPLTTPLLWSQQGINQYFY
jgi:hypothetical protein